MANAEAWITGDYPNQKLNLKLPTGATGPVGPVGPIGPASTVPGPANTLTVLDTVTGPETPGATGPQGMKGDKGDPGGITLGTIIDTQNLNDLKTAGVYRRTSTGTGLLALNYPADIDSGVLIVHVRLTDQTVLQEFHTFNRASSGSRGYYRRTFSGSTWTSWQFVGTQRVDQTAGRAIYTWDHVNDREQLIYGDTGWRDITSFLNTTDWVAASAAPRFHIRRIGNEVRFSARVQPAAAAVGANRSVGKRLFTGNHPAGFVPSPYHSYMALGTGAVDIPSKAIVQLANLSTQNELWLYGDTGVWAAPDAVGVIGNWITDDPWPTTLPGTAVGTIPNV